MKGFFLHFFHFTEKLRSYWLFLSTAEFFYFCDCLVEKSLEAKALKEFPLQSAISHISLNWKVN